MEEEVEEELSKVGGVILEGAGEEGEEAEFGLELRLF